LLTLGLFCFSELGAMPDGSVSGAVFDHRGPVPGATVMVQSTKKAVLTDTSGRFTVSGLTPGKEINLSTWKNGYYSGLVRKITPPVTGLQLKLVRYQSNDNFQYEWLAPEGKNGCSECHPALTEMSLKDPHLKSARNPRFLTMYDGTDTRGNRSPPTRYGAGDGFWNNAPLPQKPDPEKPYYGPGYLLDFPGTTGNCSACHVPGASIPRDMDPRHAKGADRYGVHCDFCHKVADVRLNHATKMPHIGAPGVHSMDIRRPFADDPERAQLFFGAFEDVNAEQHDAYLPLLKESRFCASCHFGVFWDTVVYNSYGEWLHSPYSDPKSDKAKTCQDCHMPSSTIHKGKKMTNVAPGRGGIERDPGSIHNHNMTVDAEMLRNSLTLDASATLQDGKILISVTLVNDKTGHHVPTDSPLRHLILLVEAKDHRGKTLNQLAGPQLPDWCGTHTEKGNHYAGRPGKAYAKLLREKWTEVFPAGAYWNHTELVSDNRLAAFARDVSTYFFAPPVCGKAVVTVTLLYRRAFIELMEQKKWDAPDIVMARQTPVIANP
jgi:hypothetical protein